MPFYRCNLSGGGGGVADCLAEINELVKSLGTNEILYRTSDSNDWTKVSVEAGSQTITAPKKSNGGAIVIIDFTKWTGSLLYTTNLGSSTQANSMCSASLFRKNGSFEGRLTGNQSLIVAPYYSLGIFEACGSTSASTSLTFKFQR